MAEIVVGLLGPAIELGKYIVAPIKRQFNYLCCFNSNIQNLKDEAKNLESARDELQMRVTRAQNNAEEIVPRVQTWLGKANESIQVKMQGIESEIANIQSGCLAVRSRFTLSRRAKKMAEAMKELREDSRDFDAILIAQPAPPPAMAPIPLGPTREFESRKRIEEQIMGSLETNEGHMVLGICGMGGVGKTTMAMRVTNRAREGHLFDETVMVVVSQPVDKLKIQHEMAESLGLKLEEGSSLSSRAHKLRTRLKGGKRILIVLDDVWEYLKLEELIAIPPEGGSTGCRILLTSRDRDVLRRMGAKPVCEIPTLSKDEAWSLFKEKVGTCVDDPNVLSVAKKVVEECKCLPLALVALGAALKDREDTSFWKGVLDKLQMSNPIGLPHILAEVYNPLKLSYDCLDNLRAQSIFLLCCLFPEDHNIPLEDLTAYAVGLRMFEDIDNLEKARNETSILVGMLKDRSLLLDSYDKYCVRMHDVVRDVAIFIASNERQLIKCGGNCTWVSSSHPGEWNKLRRGSDFPNLHLLLIIDKWRSRQLNDKPTDDELQINDNFFEGMIELSVLSMRFLSQSALPHTTQLLKNLRTLILHSCESLKTISVVGELVSLEIFICRDCDSIEELPLEMGRLVHLKLLEISDCWELKTIPPGVISNLIGLEDLKIIESFGKWEANDNKGKERKNAALNELASLSNLTSLGIQIVVSALAAEQIRLPPNMTKYDITIGRSVPSYGPPSSKGYEKIMNLYLPTEIIFGNWIGECVRIVERMCLGGEGSKNLDFGQAQNMRSFTLTECSKVKKLVDITSSSIVFPLLESLELDNLPNLEEICNIYGPTPDQGSSINAFKNLKKLKLKRLPALQLLWKNPYQHVASFCSNLSSIHIKKCGSLRSLFSLATAKDFLLQLERLQIEDCNMLEQVFLSSEEENRKGIGEESRDVKIIFPKLKFLKLKDLPRFTSFCKGIDSFEFPLLTRMEIGDCPKLNNQNNSGGSSHDQDDDSLHLFCNPEKVAFSSLKELVILGYKNASILWCQKIPVGFFTRLELLAIENCGNISSLFSSSIAQSLDNLKELTIERCEKMIKVIEDEEDQQKCSHACSHETTFLFRGLKQLVIRELPKLENFCGWRSCAIELPSLEYVAILDCPQMERFSLESLTTPNLKTIKMAFKDISINTDQDLNDALQQHLCIAKEEESFYKRVAKVQGLKRLSELYWSMPNLEIETKDYSLAAEQISFPSNTVKYDIAISDARPFQYDIIIGDDRRRFSLYPFGLERILKLCLSKQMTLGKWIHQCARSVEYMWLEGEGSNTLDLGQAHDMRKLIFRGCSTVKQLVNITTSSIDGGRCGTTTTTLFPPLEFLLVEDLPNLEVICHIDCGIPDGGFGSNSFKNLKELILADLPVLKHLLKSPYQNNAASLFMSNLASIFIYQCGSLPHLFSLSLSIANGCLLQLEVLEIVDCKMMEQVFLLKEEENENGIGRESHHSTIFPNLKQLTLSRLPRLTSFCQGTESIKFPQQIQMQIRDCANLKSLVLSTNNHNNSGGINNDHDHDDDSFPDFFCKPEKVVFGGLKKLVIGEYDNLLILWCDKLTNGFFTGLEELWLYHCGKIRSLFSSSIAGNLVNLKQLRIYECGEMVKVIEDDKENDACEISPIHHLFPNLEELHLCDLPELKSFCEWRLRALELRSLEQVKIKGCLKMERFSLELTLTAPNLKTIEICDRPKLEIFGLGSATPPNLKEIKINNVDIMNINGCIDVLHIQKLQIKSCQMMEQLVSLLNEEENEKDNIGQSRRGCHMAFLGLKELELCDLPNLTAFCKGIKSIEFPKLTTMKIENCPNLSTTCSGSAGTNHGDDGYGCGNDSFHLFCEPEVAFGRLERLRIIKYESNALTLLCHKIPSGTFNGLEWLRISDCGNIRSLFSSSIVGNFVNLEGLSIANCGEMVTVIDNDKGKDACGGQSTISLFPMLTWLHFSSLSKLENFCELRSSCALVLPSLEDVYLSNCSKMERFSLGSTLTTPNLETINIDDEDVIITKDLNVTLQQHFFKIKKEKEKKKKKKTEEEKEKEAEGEAEAEAEAETEVAVEEKEREEKEVDREEDQKGRGEIEEEET